MRTKTTIILLCTLMCLTSMFSFIVIPTKAQSVELKVTRVVWGTNPDSPINAYPGDTQSTLTVELQNNDPSTTIKGVSGVLQFPDGRFTDIYGHPNATATGAPTIGELLNPTDEIAPKGFLTMTFTLNIGDNVVAGTYSYNMEVKYSVKQDTAYVDGTTRSLIVQIVISKIESTITVSVTPQPAEKGQAVRVSGTISPAQENVTVTLLYKKPTGVLLRRIVKTNADGSFGESNLPDVEGFWSVNASWSGSSKYDSSWSQATFEVRLPSSITATASDNRLVGGIDDQLDITILNSGEVPVSALDLTLTLPSSSPIVFRGGSHWTINYLEPGDSETIMATIYGPSSAIETTYSGTLTVSYQNDYGESVTETFPIGLVVVGRIELVAYDETIDPQPAVNGSRVEFTTTLLNKGNIAATYVNATIQPSEILTLSSESATYIGDVEEDSQSPFTLAAYIKDVAVSGTYPIIITVFYRDDQYVDYALNVTVYVTVEAQAETQPSTGGNESVFGLLGESGFILVTVAVTTIIILLLYRHSAAKQRAIST